MWVGKGTNFQPSDVGKYLVIFWDADGDGSLKGRKVIYVTQVLSPTLIASNDYTLPEPPASFNSGGLCSRSHRIVLLRQDVVLQRILVHKLPLADMLLCSVCRPNLVLEGPSLAVLVLESAVSVRARAVLAHGLNVCELAASD